MGGYSILFFLTHVIVIVVVANLVFWIKDIDKRFKEGDEANFDDFPALVEYKRKLIESGQVRQ